MHRHAGRRSRNRRTAGIILCAGFLGLGACASLAPPRSAEPAPGAVEALNDMVKGACNRPVASVLAGEGIPVGQFRTAIYSEQRTGPSARVSQYEMWLYPRDKAGVLIIKMDETCRPMQVYTREGGNVQAFKAG
ncbi:hypothetical protein JJL56_08840 [Azospirillum sp. YIM DDC1]|uniref:Outer membrane protein assembly factor BamE n=1 Tax=Azospirillum aestuarii TaxID=2802052 RepID=A0ABS1HW13_9PROT|nr:hypothetical protein [Azospirillum aestuarii]MBK4718974.1 hypothetical protein [Azospirillum aestuarii]